MFTYADAVKGSKDIAAANPTPPAKTNWVTTNVAIPVTNAAIATHPTTYATIPAANAAIPWRMVESPHPSKEFVVVLPPSGNFQGSGNDGGISF